MRRDLVEQQERHVAALERLQPGRRQHQADQQRAQVIVLNAGNTRS
jgi:hypothetical protein